MAVPVSQAWTVATYVLKQKLNGQEEVSSRADAGAVVPLQSGVRRLRQDSVSRAHPEGGAYARRLLQGSRGVRYPDGCDPGGEPLLHPQMPEIVAGLVARKKYVYMCTNALLLKESCTCSNRASTSPFRFTSTDSASIMTFPCVAKVATTLR